MPPHLTLLKTSSLMLSQLFRSFVLAFATTPAVSAKALGSLTTTDKQSTTMELQQPGDSIARDYQDHNGVVNEKLDENDPENMLRQIKTSGTGSVTISSDLFERLYLQPKLVGPGLKHPLQKVLGNPTALYELIALIVFAVSLI